MRTGQAWQVGRYTTIPAVLSDSGMKKALQTPFAGLAGLVSEGETPSPLHDVSVLAGGLAVAVGGWVDTAVRNE